MTPAWVFRFAEPIPYARAWAWQQAVHERRRAERIPDTALLLQHPPTVTLGRRGRDHHLLASRAELAARGIELHTADRGGDVTYHAPGQWVLYPILRLGAGGADAHGHLWNLEETALRAAAEFGVRGFRRAGMSGAWAEGGKFAAIGFFVKRWITLHGMSFNVAPDLDGFRLIVPCGLVGQPVASLQTLRGPAAPDMETAGDALLRHFEQVHGRALIRQDPAAPPPELAGVFDRN